MRAIASAVAAEARASGADRGFSPELQVATDPRFGRTQENFGGDPFLVSELGVAATLAALQIAVCLSRTLRCHGMRLRVRSLELSCTSPFARCAQW